MSPSPSANQVTTIQVKRRETLVNSGDRPTSFYIFQAGTASVLQTKDGILEIYLAMSPQSILEEGLFVSGAFQAPFTVTAARDCQALEIPFSVARQQVDRCNPTLNLMLKGLAERTKATALELRSVKLARAAIPCPPDQTAKLFGIVFHAARLVGKPSGAHRVADWIEFRKLATEVFHESQRRLEEAICILAKLDYAEVVLAPDGSPEWFERITFKDMVQVENFFEFYQNYHFKGGKSTSILKTDEKIAQITKALLKVAENHKVDRNGMVTMPFKETVAAIGEILGSPFDGDQFNRLEQKGLLIKRTTTEKGGFISFLKPEFEQMIQTWKILREVEAWNAGGLVDVSAHPVLSQSRSVVVAPPAAVAPAKSAQEIILERMKTWKPAILSGGVPKIRSGGPAPGEILCPTCLSPVGQTDVVCAVCDSELDRKAS